MAKKPKTPARKRPAKRARPPARRPHSAKNATAAAPAKATLALPKLGEHCGGHGGVFHGIVIGENGKPDYMLFSAVDHQLESGTFDECAKYAKGLEVHGFADYDMPTRREQRLQWANAKPGQFKEAWYWSGEVYVAGSAYAWTQSFGDGGQTSWNRSTKDRACPVRRVPIQ